ASSHLANEYPDDPESAHAAYHEDVEQEAPKPVGPVLLHLLDLLHGYEVVPAVQLEQEVQLSLLVRERLGSILRAEHAVLRTRDRPPRREVVRVLVERTVPVQQGVTIHMHVDLDLVLLDDSREGAVVRLPVPDVRHGAGIGLRGEHENSHQYEHDNGVLHSDSLFEVGTKKLEPEYRALA